VKLSQFGVFQRVQEYFRQKEITNPTEDQLNMVRELIFQHECDERKKAEEKAEGFKEELGRVRNEKVSLNFSLISTDTAM
jgi:triphosphoribosyl-dephospho-CoA synthetase